MSWNYNQFALSRKRLVLSSSLLQPSKYYSVNKLINLLEFIKNGTKITNIEHFYQKGQIVATALPPLRMGIAISIECRDIAKINV